MLDSKYLEGMRELYLDSEKQFIEFSETVPYIDNSWYIHSPRLYSLLLAVCGQIESLMVKMCKNFDFELERGDFPECYRTLNQKGVLGIQKVKLIKTNRVLKPFFDNYPYHFWWLAHNEAKHNLPLGIQQGTIGNVIITLAALFSLHNFAIHIPHDNPQQILDVKYWMENQPITVATSIAEPERYYNPSKSKLFLPITTYYFSGRGL